MTLVKFSQNNSQTLINAFCPLLFFKRANFGCLSNIFVIVVGIIGSEVVALTLVVSIALRMYVIMEFPSESTGDPNLVFGWNIRVSKSGCSPKTDKANTATFPSFLQSKN